MSGGPSCHYYRVFVHTVAAHLMGRVAPWATNMDPEPVQEAPHVPDRTAPSCDTPCVVLKLSLRNQDWVEALQVMPSVAFNVGLQIRNHSGDSSLVIAEEAFQIADVPCLGIPARTQDPRTSRVCNQIDEGLKGMGGGGVGTSVPCEQKQHGDVTVHLVS